MTTTSKPRRQGAPRRRLEADDPRRTRADFPHGEARGYALGCSCALCREAHAAQKYFGKYGHPRPENHRRSVSTGPAREHVNWLLGHPGVKRADIARAAGLAPTSVLNIFRRETVYSTSVDAVMAVKLDDVMGSQKVVDATATRRHIKRLLKCEDASYAAVAAAAGTSYDSIQFIVEGRRQMVTAVTARAVLKLTPYLVRRNAAMVSSRRTVTRLRALQAQQFTYQELADELGLKTGRTVAQMVAIKGLVEQQTERKVEAVYNRLESRTGSSEHSAKMARRAGYWPSIHYDEDMNFIPSSIPTPHQYIPQVTPQERARMRLRIMGLTLKEWTAAEIAMAVKGSEKKIERARREVGLRLTNNRGVLEELPFIKVGQDELVRLIAEHVDPVVLAEETDAYDVPDTDYVALWTSLLAAAQQYRDRAAYVALWESLLSEADTDIAHAA